MSSSSDTSINIGPLDTTFTPSGADCTSVFYAENAATGWLALEQYLNAQSLTSCLPSGFNRSPEYYYSPGVCPSGYAYACSGTPNTGQTVATCCPSLYSCVNSRPAGALEEIYPCYSVFSSQATITVASIFYGSNAITGTKTTDVSSGNIVFANGIAVARGASDPAWPTATPTTTTPTITTPTTTSTSTGPSGTVQTNAGAATTDADSGAGLNTGAKAGIGVGVTVGALLLIGLGFLLFRRRHQKQATHQDSTTEPTMTPYQDRTYDQTSGNKFETAEVGSPFYELPVGNERPLSELPTHQ